MNGLINKTTEYDRFQFRGDNRPICKKHLKKLQGQIKIRNDLHLNPIVVNENMEIVDGQHRVKAAQNLELEIYYLIDNDFDPLKIIELNTSQKRWGLADYLNYWIYHGKEDYVKLKDFADDVKFSLSICIKWLHTYKLGGQYGNRFRSGLFKFNLRAETLNAMVSTKEFIKVLKSQNFKPVKILTSPNFHQACKFLFENKIVDHNKFFEKMLASPILLKYSLDWTDYLAQFLEIYNYRSNRKLTMAKDGTEVTIKN